MVPPYGWRAGAFSSFILEPWIYPSKILSLGELGGILVNDSVFIDPQTYFNFSVEGDGEIILSQDTEFFDSVKITKISSNSNQVLNLKFNKPFDLKDFGDNNVFINFSQFGGINIHNRNNSFGKLIK